MLSMLCWFAGTLSADPIKDFDSLKALGHPEKTLKDFRSKPLIVYHTASWCMPCKINKKHGDILPLWAKLKQFAYIEIHHEDSSKTAELDSIYAHKRGSTDPENFHFANPDLVKATNPPGLPSVQIFSPEGDQIEVMSGYWTDFDLGWLEVLLDYYTLTQNWKLTDPQNTEGAVDSIYNTVWENQTASIFYMNFLYRQQYDSLSQADSNDIRMDLKEAVKRGSIPAQRVWEGESDWRAIE